MHVHVCTLTRPHLFTSKLAFSTNTGFYDFIWYPRFKSDLKFILMNSDHSYILCKKLTIPAYVYFTVVLIINEVCFKIKKKTGILQKAHDLSSTRTEGGVCTGDLCSQQVPSISSWFLSMATKCIT